MTRTTHPTEVRRALILREEIALLDVREEFHFAHGHPLFAAQLSLSQLELDIGRRVPRRGTRIVVYDNGEGHAEIAAARLNGLGYTEVSRLEGGLQGWIDAGYEVFEDVNSYSKAFGELVEARRHTPSLPAQELQARLDRREDLVVLDARRFDEYQTMSIPTGVSVPGAELVLRARSLAPDPSTVIVVNCAGRTRSLIGAQSLINAGVPNPVYALRNGTIGWTLAGQSLDRGRNRHAPDPAPDRAAHAVAQARAVSYRAGVRHISPADFAHLAEDATRTLYRFDVRTPEEHAAGPPSDFLSAPGGQLVQETDMFAPVRGARIVLFDDVGARADMTASWLAQMGWEVFVLDGRPADGPDLRPVQPPEAPGVATIEAEALDELLRHDAVTLIDLAPSPVYRRGHIPGAAFAIRSRLLEALAGAPAERPIVLTAPDVRLAQFATADVEAITGIAPRVLYGGTPAWSWEGRSLETGDGRPLNPFEDVYRRPYEGTDNPAEAMQAYLDWEFGLVAQLERDGSHGFFVI
jgi:rhodanese-related sulfurtransferase